MFIYQIKKLNANGIQHKQFVNSTKILFFRDTQPTTVKTHGPCTTILLEKCLELMHELSSFLYEKRHNSCYQFLSLISDKCNYNRPSLIKPLPQKTNPVIKSDFRSNERAKCYTLFPSREIKFSWQKGSLIRGELQSY